MGRERPTATTFAPRPVSVRAGGSSLTLTARSIRKIPSPGRGRPSILGGRRRQRPPPPSPPPPPPRQVEGSNHPPLPYAAACASRAPPGQAIQPTRAGVTY